MFADHRTAPLLVPFGADKLESRVLINVARGLKDAVRPQYDFSISGLAGESDALFAELRSQSQAARLRIDEQEPEPRDAR